MQYLLTLQVSRYCLLALQISIIGDEQRTEPRRVCDEDQDVIHLEFILSNSEPKSKNVVVIIVVAVVVIAVLVIVVVVMVANCCCSQ